MERKPDLITVTAKHKETLAATGVDLHVTIRGESFVTGKAALRKAKEVAKLVSELTDGLIEP